MLKSVMTIMVFGLIVPLMACSPSSTTQKSEINKHSPGEEDWQQAMTAYEAGRKKEAFSWASEGAKKGNVDAQLYLAAAYADGQGVPLDDALAVKWYRKAAKQNNAGAQLALGVIYQDGRGVEQDLAKAAKWYFKAADQGLGEAQFNLGRMYASGEGVAKDYAQTYFWFNLAFLSGIEQAEEGRDIVAGGLAAADLEKAKARTRQWLKAHK